MVILPQRRRAPVKRLALCLVAIVLTQTASTFAQNAPADPDTTLRVNSRAVLIDVLVTDRGGNPVTGLKRENFTVTEQGKPQPLNFFEEHRALSSAQAQTIQFPQLPPDVFTNFSPIAPPPAVNILLLDALNTPMADQIYLRQAAQHFLKTLKPGSRLAIFTLSQRLSFVQGFADDPYLLARALGYRKNDKPEPAVLLQSQEEATAQDTVVGLMNQMVGAGPGALTTAGPANMIEAFQQFLKETQYAQTSDREYRTTQALQQLASYLAAFPGRKNLIWMTGAFPLDIFGLTDMRFDDITPKTVNLLSAARVALYPVDVRGAWTHSLHTAEHTLDPTIGNAQQLLGPAAGFAPSTADSSNIVTGQAAVTTASGGFDHALAGEDIANNSSNAAMDMVAQQTGGRAFYNGNDLASIVDKVVSTSSDFYTLSYSPSDTNMNGALRKIHVDVAGGSYTLCYRQGYYARDEGLPGAAQTAQSRAVQQAAHNGANPLQPFMDFGLPQTGQILYKVKILPASAPDTAPAPAPDSPVKGPHDRYSVDFAIDLKDLDLPLDPADGLHKGTLNLNLIVYDRYGQIANRRDHLVALNIKPDIWKIFEQTGVQLHADIDVPRGQYWLRTGVYDASTRKVGTMEIPFSSVHPLQASAQQP
ncbi:VWA domain-containing protein [Acidobacteria bacterium AB60]|nr:VWA domain-containing protein [Acidobacteria bacterium AB60]